jgi:antitoxin component of RelBE/YafQ-DinJ toxin-antitoxin module
MKGTVTIRIDEELERRLEQVCARSGLTRSDVVRESLRRHLSLMQFEQIRERVVPLAEARGYRVDEDVFREVS